MGLFDSVKDRVSQFADENSKQRLLDCQKADEVVRQCLNNPQYDPTSLEKVPAISRVARYHGWVQTDVEDSVNSKSGVRATLRLEDTGGTSACALEMHSLWGCRALAVGCANPLERLRGCLQDYPPSVVAGVGRVAYTETAPISDKALDKKLPCGALQREVGKCIMTRTENLAKRVAARKTAATEAKEQDEQKLEK